MTAPLGTAELAREIARTRARLSRSLVRLDREYALRHLVVRAGRMMRSAERPELSQALRHEAVPLALVMLGLGWLSLAEGRESATLLRRVLDSFRGLQLLAEELGLLLRRTTAAPSGTIENPPTQIERS